MNLNFYGIRADPPTVKIAQSFGSSAELLLLQGGQKTTYQSGKIVLKPTDDI